MVLITKPITSLRLFLLLTIVSSVASFELTARLVDVFEALDITPRHTVTTMVQRKLKMHNTDLLNVSGNRKTLETRDAVHTYNVDYGCMLDVDGVGRKYLDDESEDMHDLKYSIAKTPYSVFHSSESYAQYGDSFWVKHYNEIFYCTLQVSIKPVDFKLDVNVQNPVERVQKLLDYSTVMLSTLLQLNSRTGSLPMCKFNSSNLLLQPDSREIILQQDHPFTCQQCFNDKQAQIMMDFAKKIQALNNSRFNELFKGLADKPDISGIFKNKDYSRASKFVYTVEEPITILEDSGEEISIEVKVTDANKDVHAVSEMTLYRHALFKPSTQSSVNKVKGESMKRSTFWSDASSQYDKLIGEPELDHEFYALLRQQIIETCYHKPVVEHLLEKSIELQTYMQYLYEILFKRDFDKVSPSLIKTKIAHLRSNITNLSMPLLNRVFSKTSTKQTEEAHRESVKSFSDAYDVLTTFSRYLQAYSAQQSDEVDLAIIHAAFRALANTKKVERVTVGGEAFKNHISLFELGSIIRGFAATSKLII